MALRLKRLGNGIYETADGQYRVERITAMDEFDHGEAIWLLTKRPEHGNPEVVDWDEIAERPTKRECVTALEHRLERES